MNTIENNNETKGDGLVKRSMKGHFFAYLYKNNKRMLIYSFIILILIILIYLLIFSSRSSWTGYASFGAAILMFPFIILGVVTLISLIVKIIISIINYFKLD